MANSRTVVLLAGILISLLCPAEEQSVPSATVPISVTLDEDIHQCEVLVNHASVLKVDCYGLASPPRVIANYSDGFGSLQQVVVFQELPSGNACNGGPLHILAITLEKKPLVAGPIDWCGGKDPLVSRKGKTVFITLPGGPPNRPIPGTNEFIPTEKWSFKEGHITRIK